MRTIQQPGPPAPERIQWVEARGRAFSFTLRSGRAAAGSRAPRLCRARIFRRRPEFPGRGARPLRLCDAGAVEDRRQRRLLQRHFSARRRDAAEDGRDDAWAARRRAVLPLPRAVDGGRWPRRRRPYPAGRNRGRRAVRGRGVRDRRRDVLGRAGPRDQFQTVRAGAVGGLRSGDDEPCLCAAAAAEPGFCRRAGDVSAASGASPAPESTAASAAPSARALRTAAASSRSRRNLRSARASLHPAPAARSKPNSTLRWSTTPAASPRAGLLRGDNPVLMTMELVLEVVDGL